MTAPREPFSGLPTPVAALLRAARTAKSPRARHEVAVLAWEASARLVLAAAPPSPPPEAFDLDAWLHAATLPAGSTTSPAVLRCHALFLTGDPAHRSLHAELPSRAVLEALPPYAADVRRHPAGSRELSEEARELLVEGVVAGWRDGVFLPAGARLVYPQEVVVEESGELRATLIDLMNGEPEAPDLQGTLVPDGVVPERLHLLGERVARQLYPWVLFSDSDPARRFWFFDGRSGGTAYIDLVGGEVLRGTDLESAFPDARSEVGRHYPTASAPTLVEDTEEGTLGEYELIGALGVGGMGEVHLARHVRLGRLAAVKLLPARFANQDDALRRFDREVEALRRTDHPNVVRILGHGEARGTRYYAMELVEGCELRDLAATLPSASSFGEAVARACQAARERLGDTAAALPPLDGESDGQDAVRSRAERARRLARCFRDAARGLHHLHELGVVHRDITPGNLMITAGDHRVVIMDLGVALLDDATLMMSRAEGSFAGTLRYAAPEQLMSRSVGVDRRADVYGLGATLYELLTGRPFFDGDTEPRVVEQVLHEEPVPPRKAAPGVPRDLATIVSKATQKDRRRRYQTARELARDLEAFLEGRPITARPATLPYLTSLWVRRHAGVAATVAVALIALLGLGGWFTGRLARKEAELVRKAQDLDLQRRAFGAWAAALTDDLDCALILGMSSVAGEPVASVAAGRRALQSAIQRTVPGRILHAGEDVVWAGFWPPTHRILTTHEDGRMRLWTPEGALLHEAHEHVGRVRHVRFGPLGTEPNGAVTTGADNRTCLWTARLELLECGPGHANTPATPLPSGHEIVRGRYGEDVIVLQDLATNETRRLEAGLSWPLDVAATTDGTRFAIASRLERGAILTTGGKLIATLRNRSDATPTWDERKLDFSIARFSPEGDRLVIAAGHVPGINTEANEAFLWNGVDGSRIAELAHDGTVRDARFALDGAVVITAGKDGAVLAWNAEDGSGPVELLRAEVGVTALAVDDAGGLLYAATADGAVSCHPLPTPESLDARRSVPAPAAFVLPIHLGGVRVLELTSDRSRALTLSGAGVLGIWDVRHGPVQHQPPVVGIATVPARSLAATADESGLIVVHAPDAEHATRFRVDRSPRDLALSPRGDALWVMAGDGTLEHWTREADGWQAAWKRRVFPDWGHSVAATNSATRLVAAAWDANAILLDAETGSEVARLPHGHYVLAVAAADDVVATGSLDGTVRTWNTDGTPRAVGWGHDLAVDHVELSADGTVVLSRSQDGTARTWTGDGEQLAVLRAPSGLIQHARLSPGGQRVVTASDDGGVHAWSVRGALLGWSPPSASRGGITALAFSDDGQTVAVTGTRRNLELWQSDLGTQREVLDCAGAQISMLRFAGSTLVGMDEQGRTLLWGLDAKPLTALAADRAVDVQRSVEDCLGAHVPGMAHGEGNLSGAAHAAAHAGEP